MQIDGIIINELPDLECMVPILSETTLDVF